MQAVDEAMDRWPLARQAWENVTWAIMQEPAVGAALNESGSLRLVEYAGSFADGEPTVRVVFERVSEAQIILRAAQFLDARFQSAGSA